MKKLGIMLLMCLFLVTSAFALTETVPYTLFPVSPVSISEGYIVEFNESVTLTQICVDSGVTATKIEILDENGTEVAESSVSGGCASFTASLAGGVNYSLSAHADGAAYDRVILDCTANYPFDTGYTTWKAGYKEGDVPNNQCYNIKNLTLSFGNSVSVSIADEDTLNLILQNMSVQLVGNVVYSNVTDTGNLTFPSVLAGDYQVRWYAVGTEDYLLRERYLTQIEGVPQTLNLYSYNYSQNLSIINVVFTIINQNLNVYEGAIVTLSKWDSTSSSFLDIEQRTTDSNGQVLFVAEEDISYYRWRVEVNNDVKYISPAEGTRFEDDNGDGIYSRNIPINLEDNIYEDTVIYNDITATLTFTNTSDTSGYYNFVGSSDVAYTYCLAVSKYYSGQHEQTESCQVSSSPDILVNVNTTTSVPAKYVATVNVELPSGGIYTLASREDDLSFNLASTNENWLQNGIFVMILLAIIPITFIVEVPLLVPILQGVVTLIYSVGFGQFGLVSLPMSGAMFIIAMSFIIVFSMRRSRE